MHTQWKAHHTLAVGCVAAWIADAGSLVGTDLRGARRGMIDSPFGEGKREEKKGKKEKEKTSWCSAGHVQQSWARAEPVHRNRNALG